jgi:predicted RNase H-like HicB family nuclease
MVEYTVIIHEAEEGGYWTEVPSLPGAGSQGETLEEALEMTKESIAMIIAALEEDGKPVPVERDIIVKVAVGPS